VPLITVSPSQLGLYQRCPRRWAFRYIGKIKPPRPSYYDFGDSAHKYLENWYRDGAAIDTSTKEGDLAHRLLDILPSRGASAPELHFVHPLCEGVELQGYIDLLTPDGDGWAVDDYKFYATMDYAETEASLAENLQANIYSWATGGDCTFSMNYGLKKAKTVEKVSRCMPIAETTKFVQGLVPTARLIVGHLARGDVNAVPRNPTVCDHTSDGCPYGERCNLGEIEMDQEFMQRLEAMKAKAAAEAGVNPPEAAELETPAPPPEPEPEPEPEPVKKPRGRPRKAPVTAAPPPPSPPAAPAPAETKLAIPVGGTVTITIRIEP